MAVAVCLAAAAAGTAGARGTHGVRTYVTGATPPMRTGIFDPFTFVGDQAAAGFTLTRSTGATYARIPVAWNGIAPSTPLPGFVANDPDSPGYSWSWLDGVVGLAEAAGLTPILEVGSAPSWAVATLGAGGTGSPDPVALAQFASAIATHYDGVDGAPPVHVFQVWNEPNLSLDMSPVSADAYRTMVNAFTDAVHAVDPQNLVVAGGLDPFGHKPTKTTTWYSEAPLTFMRELLCLPTNAHLAATCSNPVHFDVWAHHPYTFGGPFGEAKHPGDVELGDLPKMRALLREATKLHRIVSARPVEFWVTEVGWDTAPPESRGLTLALQARWTSEALFQMWRSGVTLAAWFQIADQPMPSHYASGLYFYSPSLADASPKPAATAFRFPFVAYLGKGKVQVWGRDATSSAGTVTVQLRHGAGGSWQTVARISANGRGIFRATLPLAATAKDWLRATASGSGDSLAFSLRVPKTGRIGPWGN